MVAIDCHKVAGAPHHIKVNAHHSNGLRHALQKIKMEVICQTLV